MRPCLYFFGQPLSVNISSGLGTQDNSAQPVAPVSFDDEQVILTQSDMDASSFGVNDAGKTVLFSFGSIRWLPLGFERRRTFPLFLAYA